MSWLRSCVFDNQDIELLTSVERNNDNNVSHVCAFKSISLFFNQARDRRELMWQMCFLPKMEAGKLGKQRGFENKYASHWEHIRPFSICMHAILNVTLLCWFRIGFWLRRETKWETDCPKECPKSLGSKGWFCKNLPGRFVLYSGTSGEDSCQKALTIWDIISIRGCVNNRFTEQQ